MNKSDYVIIGVSIVVVVAATVVVVVLLTRRSKPSPPPPPAPPPGIEPKPARVMYDAPGAYYPLWPAPVDGEPSRMGEPRRAPEFVYALHDGNLVYRKNESGAEWRATGKKAHVAVMDAEEAGGGIKFRVEKIDGPDVIAPLPYLGDAVACFLQADGLIYYYDIGQQRYLCTMTTSTSSPIYDSKVVLHRSRDVYLLRGHLYLGARNLGPAYYSEFDDDEFQFDFTFEDVAIGDGLVTNFRKLNGKYVIFCFFYDDTRWVVDVFDGLYSQTAIQPPTPPRVPPDVPRSTPTTETRESEIIPISPHVTLYMEPTFAAVEKLHDVTPDIEYGVHQGRLGWRRTGGRDDAWNPTEHDSQKAVYKYTDVATKIVFLPVNIQGQGNVDVPFVDNEVLLFFVWDGMVYFYDVNKRRYLWTGNRDNAEDLVLDPGNQVAVRGGSLYYKDENLGQAYYTELDDPPCWVFRRASKYGQMLYLPVYQGKLVTHVFVDGERRVLDIFDGFFKNDCMQWPTPR